MTSRGVRLRSLLVACTLAVAACASDGSDTTSSEPSPSAESALPSRASGPSTAPETDEPVTTEPTATASTQLDTSDEPASFTAGPCPTQPPDLAITCGTVALPLNHDEPQGATILLVVAVLHSANVDAANAPVFFLGGGPGEQTVGPILKALAPDSPLLQLAAERDVVFVEQRGTGLSQPALDCPEYAKAVAEITTTAQIHDAAVAGITECKQRLLAAGVDLSAFDTAADVIDLDLTRRALGYESISLFGTSYGARLALQAARAFPETIESVALSSPVPAEANFVLDAGASFDRALTAVSDACAADPACSASYPDVAGTLTTALDDLAAAPATVEVTNPTTGQVVPVEIDAATAATVLFSMFYVPDGPATVPFLVDSLSKRDLTVFANPSSVTGPMAISLGAQLSFLCAEEASGAAPTEFEGGDLGAGALLTASNPIVGPTLWDLCEVWDVAPGDPITFDPVTTDVPMLIVTGQFDQITPPSYGEQIRDHASKAWYVEIPGVGHAPLTNVGPCGIALLTAFVDQPDVEPSPDCELAGPGFYSPEDIAELEEQAQATTTTG